MKAIALALVLVSVSAAAKAAKAPDPDLGIAIMVFDTDGIARFNKGPNTHLEVPLVNGEPDFKRAQIMGPGSRSCRRPAATMKSTKPQP